MAKDKKSFILYVDQKDLWNKLPDVIAGKLIKHIYSYVNDENPNSADLIVEIAFEPIKQQLKRDLKLFEEKRVKRSEAGLAGATKRWKEMPNDANEWQTIANDSKRINGIAKIADNVNVNDNVISKDIYTKQKFSFLSALIENGFDEQLSKEWMQVRKQLKAVNTETAFNSFMSEVKKHGGDRNKILRKCVERSWKGFNHTWLEKENDTLLNALNGIR